MSRKRSVCGDVEPGRDSYDFFLGEAFQHAMASLTHRERAPSEVREFIRALAFQIKDLDAQQAEEFWKVARE